MKPLVSCALLLVVFSVSFAHHEELCEKDDEQLKSELICIKLLISQEANKSFNDAKKDLNCNSRSCVIRKLCEGGDLNAAMEQYFTDEQILEIHNAATACDPDAANEDDSPITTKK
ncbi:hypothetical protein MRX96_009085 [Rhipicephalus microplus]